MEKQQAINELEKWITEDLDKINKLKTELRIRRERVKRNIKLKKGIEEEPTQSA